MVSTESKTTLAGVTVCPLKRLDNERGHLMEVQRADDPHYLGFAQAYITATKPGVIKGWYCHRKQTDQLAIVKGALLLVLYDARKDSPSFGQVMEIPMEAHSPTLVQFPPGIWHAFQTVSQDDAYVLHLNDTAFDFENTDEERLPVDTDQIPYQWSERPHA